MRTWRPVTVPGFEHSYEVSDDGHVRSLLPRSRLRGRELSIFRDSKGYARVNLSHPRPSAKTIHALVAGAFLGLRPAAYEINHKDGDKSNNRVENLEYVTQADNMAHAVATGLHTRGETHGAAKLTEAQVREIYQSTETQSAAGRRYGVNSQTVHAIRHHKIWKHLQLNRHDKMLAR